MLLLDGFCGMDILCVSQSVITRGQDMNWSAGLIPEGCDRGVTRVGFSAISQKFTGFCLDLHVPVRMKRAEDE